MVQRTPFLLNDYEPWPEQPEFNEILLPNNKEVKKESVCNVLQDSTILNQLLQQFSNYQKMMKRYGMVIKVQDVRMLETWWSNSPPTGSLSIKDIKEATKQIVKLVQWNAFPAAMKRLSSEKRNGRRYLSLEDLNNLPCLKLHRKLNRYLSLEDLNNLPCLKLHRKLNPFLEEKVMRAGGRLRNSDLEYNAKHPMILLPPNHPITAMIIEKEHGEQGYSGISHILNKLHQRY